MFSLLETKEEIRKAQRQLEATIRREFSKRVVKSIGFPSGGVDDVEVATNGKHWFWSADFNDSHIPNKRRLNWFGLFQAEGKLQISVEINTEYERPSNQVAGFFARDNDTGTIYLMHSGRIAGGQKGVGKDAFLAWSDLRPIEVVNASGGIREGVLVMPVDRAGATRSAIRYIDIIAQFKRAVREGVIDTPEFKRKQKELLDFYAESRGRRKGKRSGEIDYISRHGDVVDALHSWRKQAQLPTGGRLVKNVFIDLGVAVGRSLVEVYEVKTSTARGDIYAAIGQLMVHGTDNGCRRVMVLPHAKAISSDLKDAIQRLRIELQRFELDQEKATIL